MINFETSAWSVAKKNVNHCNRPIIHNSTEKTPNVEEFWKREKESETYETVSLNIFQIAMKEKF